MILEKMHHVLANQKILTHVTNIMWSIVKLQFCPLIRLQEAIIAKAEQILNQLPGMPFSFIQSYSKGVHIHYACHFPPCSCSNLPLSQDLLVKMKCLCSLACYLMPVPAYFEKLPMTLQVYHCVTETQRDLVMHSRKLMN